jgi:hypothetical protein
VAQGEDRFVAGQRGQLTGRLGNLFPGHRKGGHGVTKQLRDVAAMYPLWPLRLRDNHRGFVTFEQRHAAVCAKASEGSPRLQSAAISTRDSRHQTPPSAAVAHARPAGTPRYSTRRRTLCSHRSLVVIGATILEVPRSEADPRINGKQVRPGTIERETRGLAAVKRFICAPPSSDRLASSPRNGGKGQQGLLRGLRRLTSSAPCTFSVSQGT